MSVEVSIEAVLAHCTREGLEALIPPSSSVLALGGPDPPP